MKLPHFSTDPRELGISWFLVPALCVFAALAGYVVLSSVPALLADSVAAQGRADAAALPLAPPSTSDFSVPDAATVFKDRPYEVSEHVDTF
jgi:uncharacterized membrane protein